MVLSIRATFYDFQDLLSPTTMTDAAKDIDPILSRYNPDLVQKANEIGLPPSVLEDNGFYVHKLFFDGTEDELRRLVLSRWTAPPGPLKRQVACACEPDYMDYVESYPFDMVFQLVDIGIDINRINVHNIDPIQAAIRQQNIPIIDKCVKSGFDWNAKPELITPAITLGYKDIVVYFAENGFTHLNNAFRSACYYQQMDIAYYLLTKGADVNYNDPITPLFTACRDNKMTTIDLLLKHGADVNQTNACNGETPIFGAVLHGNRNVIDLLIEKGAVCTLKDKYYRSPLDGSLVSQEMKDYVMKQINKRSKSL